MLHEAKGCQSPQIPDSQDRCLLPHAPTLLVFPSSDLHYQVAEKIKIKNFSKNSPTCFTTRWAKFSHGPEATKGNGGETLTPDIMAPWMQGKETSSGKSLCLQQPIQTLTQRAHVRQRPPGRPGGGDLPTLSDQAPPPCSLWYGVSTGQDSLFFPLSGFRKKLKHLTSSTLHQKKAKHVPEIFKYLGKHGGGGRFLELGKRGMREAKK